MLPDSSRNLVSAIRPCSLRVSVDVDCQNQQAQGCRNSGRAVEELGAMKTCKKQKNIF